MMSVTGSARNIRRTSKVTTTKKKKKKHVFAVLLSCCIFLAVLCACLLTALVLIGKHHAYNSSEPSNGAIDKVAQGPAPQFRLPNDTIPLHYDIFLAPNLVTGGYSGQTNITVNLTAKRTNFIVHSKNLTIVSVTVTSKNGSKLPVQNVEEDEVVEMFIIHTKYKLQPGIYYLFFEFNASLLDRRVGFYRSQYLIRGTKEKRSIATSKFEPTYARQAFPCFDEPNMKASFTVHLLKPKDDQYIALSNMPQEGEEDTDDGVLVHFQESVKMSTYLSCFIVSDFKYKEDFINPDTDNITLRVYSTPAQVEKTTFALQTAKKVIEYFIGYFNISYPLPKLDLAAIPDFVSGAMEHWGLVTFRETALLFDEQSSSSANKQRIAEVVAHELAHSWFGNLVTMDWWNDLWLNEGFASYIEIKGVHSAYSDWQMLDQFLVQTLHSVLSFDSTPASHPIVANVITPDQITEIFDTITYNKGASLLRMLENAVGEAAFQTGTTNYLNNHLYGNAVTKHFFDEMQHVVGDAMNISEFMSTWTEQMGYPILNVTAVGDKYVITQKQFLKQPADKHKMKSSVFNYKWSVPVTYIADNLPEPVLIWFNYKEDTLTIDKPKDASWVKFNAGQVGYYRVNYEEDHWNVLSNNIKSMTIADRTHLLEESFSIAATGEVPYTVPLSLTKYLKEENEYLPWRVALSKFSGLENYFSNSAQFQVYKNYILDLLTPIYDHLGWDILEKDGHLDRLKKGVILGAACKFGHQPCLDEVKRKFSDWLNDNSVQIPQDLKSVVYRHGVQTGTAADWEKMWNKYIGETDANEKTKIMDGLTSTQNPELIHKMIDLAKDDTYIRSQDYFTMLSWTSENQIGTPIVWDYVRENWPQLVDRFTLNDRYLGNLISSITKSFTTQTKLEEMYAFFEKYPEAGAGKTARAQAIENVKNNINWLRDHKAVVEKWLLENAPTSKV